MTALEAKIAGDLLAGPAFPPSAHERFTSGYPEEAHMLHHDLCSHPLLALDALAALGESLPEASVDFARDRRQLAEGCEGGNPLTIGEAIRMPGTSGSGVVLNNIEQHPAYAALLAGLLEEIGPQIARRTGMIRDPRGFVFVSSPAAVTPYHFDREHKMVLQLVGNKEMTVFPAGDERFSPMRVHQTYGAGSARELAWNHTLLDHGSPFQLGPGQALYLPVMAPHLVRNGPRPSVALSIAWHSDWSAAEADARSFNRWLRRRGLDPRSPGRWPAGNRAKAWGWRALQRLGIEER